jgi:hypothetical protein
MQDDEKNAHIKQVAKRFKVICNEQIEEIEDRLPKVLDSLERDSLLKRIDALEQIADEANARAEEMIESYYQNKNDENTQN